MSSNADHPGLAVVTGASRGLGRELVHQLATRGHEVLALCRNPADLPLLPGRITALALDVTDAEAAHRAAATLNGRPVDLLINNAAIRGATGGLDEVEQGDFLSVMAVNALGPLLVTRAFLPNLRKGRGLVANISSRAGSMTEGSDPDGDYAYKCSKAALNMATVKLAEDTGLTVLALHPGWLKTAMGGQGAELDPACSAAALLDLLERAGPQHSGQFLTWDGKPVAW
jgi:NAD(P)-dependent dehydrogenase (short-subunit alcohol dehydrogenase family)